MTESPKREFTQEELEAHHRRLLEEGVPAQELGMRIDRDGRWFHDGGLIERKELVRTLSSLLVRLDDGSHWLVNPAEHGRIEVEDAPFTASLMAMSGDGDARVLRFTTNLGGECVLDDDHPLVVRQGAGAGEPRPYILVRGRLEARIDRQAYYDLVELAEERDGVAGVRSSGSFFPLEARPEKAGAA